MGLGFRTASSHLSDHRIVSMPGSNLPPIGLAFATCVLAALPSSAADPFTISPGSCRPGVETSFRIAGEGIDEGFRALCMVTGSSLEFEQLATGHASFRLRVPPDAPPGPFGLWLANAAGPLPPVSLLVDELPAVIPDGDHGSVESAQRLDIPVCLSGISRASGGDYYRLSLAAGQRLACEVWTQPLGSGMEPVVSLRDREGRLLLRFDNDGIGHGCRFEFEAAEQGDYFLELHDNQFRGGHRYHLRLGDFPIVRHAFPLGVAAGQPASIELIGDAGERIGAAEIIPGDLPQGSAAAMTIRHPVRLSESLGDAWVPLYVSPLPQIRPDGESPAKASASPAALSFPAVIHGRLGDPGDVARHDVRGQTGQAIRFRARTHSLGSPVWLRMRLLDAEGQPIASSDDAEGEEPSLTHEFADGAAYTLEVTDRFGRGGVGGAGFAYLIEAAPPPPLTLELRADGKRELTLSAGGVCAVDVDLGYGDARRGDAGAGASDAGPGNGERRVTLQLSGDHTGVRLVPAEVPAGAEQARVFIFADESWGERSMVSLGLRARFSDAPSTETPIGTHRWARKQHPEIRFPPSWGEGRLLVAGTKAADPPFDVRTDGAAEFVRGAERYRVTIEHLRGDEAWKGDLTVLGDGLPDGWSVGFTQDGDRYEAEWARQPDAIVDPERLVLRFVAERDGRFFARTLVIEPDWSDPVTALEVHPASVTLSGPRARSQLVVAAAGERDPLRDRTGDASIRSADPAIAKVEGSVVFPVGDGETEIVVELAGHRRTIPVTVRDLDAETPVAFESEVLVALSKQGCNSGACHGSPSGKGMFRLSLRGFDPELDALTLIREDFGRRVNPLEAGRSLLLLKPLMKVAHGGGKRIAPTDDAYKILRDWIAGGARPDPPGTPRCESLRVYPSTKRISTVDAGPQQIAVIAQFEDGTRRDVTHLAVYESSDERVATVDGSGSVRPLTRGETVVLVRFLEHIVPVPFLFKRPSGDFVWRAPEPRNEIDRLVQEKLRQIEFLPADVCEDEVFVRRLFLDLTGVPPTADEVRAFLGDPRPDKRQSLADELLEREAFAKFWALKWGDWLKMTAGRLGPSGVYKYHRWVEQAFRDNLPYDRFAKRLLTASGSTQTNPAANFYRAADDLNESVETVSQVFLGARIQCATCHNHPFERWTQDNYYGLAAFFRRIDRQPSPVPGEVLIAPADSGEVTQPRTGEIAQPWLPEAGTVEIDPAADRRAVFADWLIDPSNPLFAQVETNRIWAQFFARGLVDPIDDFRASNPPTNEAVLRFLADEFVASGFDRKHLIRLIVNSGTYQASHRSDEGNRDDSHYFSHQRPRRLSAESLFDAIHQTLGIVADLRPLPPGTPATHLPAPDLAGVEFLKAFGQPARSTVCACERPTESNLAMAIELLNGELVHRLLRDPQNRFRRSLAAGEDLADVIDQVYLAALARLPSDDERRTAIDHCESQPDPARGLEDVCWALFNTDEFLFQH